MSNRVETFNLWTRGPIGRHRLKKWAHRLMRRRAKADPQGAPHKYPYFTPWG